MCDGTVRTHLLDSLVANGALNKLSLTIWNGYINTCTLASDVLTGKGDDKVNQSKERY